MKNKLIILGTILIAGVGIFSGLAVGGNTPPGQDPCSHGNTGKVCRPDPQPNRGKDCLHHGKKGGVNEDHCAGTTTGTTTDTNTTTSTTTNTTTTVRTVTAPGQTITITPGPPPAGQTVPQPLPSPTVEAHARAKAKAKAKQKARILKSVIANHHAPKTTG